METHSNGRENATQLESRLSNHGVLYHAQTGHGFIVIGDEQIFIVEEESPDRIDGFSFEKIPIEHIESFKVELGSEDNRYEQGAEKASSDGGQSKPTTHIRLHLKSHAIDFYADADPREVASSFVTFTLETKNSND